MKALAQIALETIEGYKNNKVIMDFVTEQAHEATAKDMKEKSGSTITAKGVQLMSYTNKEVKARVDEYIKSGLVGCYLASLK